LSGTLSASLYWDGRALPLLAPVEVPESWKRDSPEERLPRMLLFVLLELLVILLLVPIDREADLPARGLRGLDSVPSDELRLRRGLVGGENVDKKFIVNTSLRSYCSISPDYSHVSIVSEVMR
jgi:hypothetical protein